MSFSKMALFSAAALLGAAAVAPAADVVITDDGYTINLAGTTQTFTGAFLSPNGSLADQGEIVELSGKDSGTVLITGGGSLTYGGGSRGDGYYTETYSMSRGDVAVGEGSANWAAWEGMDSFWSAGIFTGSVVVDTGTTLNLEGQLTQYVEFRVPTATDANHVSDPAFGGYAGVSGITLRAGATLSFESSALNMVDSRPSLGGLNSTSGYLPNSVLALNFVNNLDADATSRLVIGTDEASANRIVLNADAGKRSTVGRLVGNGRLYTTGAGTISFIGVSELDPGTRLDENGEVDTAGNTWLEGNRLADILLGTTVVNVGSADGGVTVVDNVFAGATAVSFLRENASSNATVSGGVGTTVVNGAANYIGNINNSFVNVYGHQVFNNFQSLWVERSALSAETVFNSGSGGLIYTVEAVYEPVRFSWIDEENLIFYSTGSENTVNVLNNAVLTIDQAYGRDGWFTGTLNTQGTGGLVVKTGEGSFLYSELDLELAGRLTNLRVEEGTWISSGSSLGGSIVLSGTGELKLLVSQTSSFGGVVRALSTEADLTLARSYTLLNDLEDPANVDPEALTEDDYRTYYSFLDQSTAALQFTESQTLFYGSVRVTEGVTLILGTSGGNAYESIFPVAQSIELIGEGTDNAGQLRYSSLQIVGGTQLVRNLVGGANSAVTIEKGAKLVLTQTDTEAVYAGGFAGNGDLVKLGTNNQTVSANLNGSVFAGNLVVLAGSVSVNQTSSSAGPAALLLKSGTSAAFSAPARVGALVGESGSTVSIAGDFTVAGSTVDASLRDNPANLVYTSDSNVYDGAFAKLFATTGTDRHGNDIFGMMRDNANDPDGIFGNAENVSQWLRNTFTEENISAFLATNPGNMSEEMQASLRDLAARISGSSAGVLAYLDGNGNLNADGWNAIVAAGGLEYLKTLDPTLDTTLDEALGGLADESLYSFITHYLGGYTYEFILTESNANQIGQIYGVPISGWLSGTPDARYEAFNNTFSFATGTEFAGTLSGNGNLVKTGTGTLKLTGQNSYTGTTVVSGGELSINWDSVRATSGIVVERGAKLTINGGTTTGDYGALFAGSETRAEAARLSGAGTVVKQGAGNVDLVNALRDVADGAADFTGTLELHGGALRATVDPVARTAGGDPLQFTVNSLGKDARFDLVFARSAERTYIAGTQAAELSFIGDVKTDTDTKLGTFSLDAGTTREFAEDGSLKNEWNNVLRVEGAFSVGTAEVKSGTLEIVTGAGSSDFFNTATIASGAELAFTLSGNATLDNAKIEGSVPEGATITSAGTLVVTTSANAQGSLTLGADVSVSKLNGIELGGSATLAIDGPADTETTTGTTEESTKILLETMTTTAGTTLSIGANRTVVLTGEKVVIGGSLTGAGTLVYDPYYSADAATSAGTAAFLAETTTATTGTEEASTPRIVIGNAEDADSATTTDEFGGSLSILGGTLELAAGANRTLNYSGIELNGPSSGYVEIAVEKTGAGKVYLSQGSIFMKNGWDVAVKGGELAVDAVMLDAAALPESLRIDENATFRFAGELADNVRELALTGGENGDMALSGAGTLAFDYETSDLTITAFDSSSFSGVVELTKADTTLTLGAGVTEFAAFSGAGTLEVSSGNLTVRVDSNADGLEKFEGKLAGDNLTSLTVLGGGTLMLTGTNSVPTELETLVAGSADKNGGVGVSSSWAGTISAVGATSRVMIDGTTPFAGTTKVGAGVQNLVLGYSGTIELGENAVSNTFKLQRQNGSAFALNGSVNATLSNIAGENLTLTKLAALNAENFALHANRDGSIVFSGATAGTWDKDISGEGGIRVENGANLTLTAGALTYTGKTVVETGSTLTYGNAGTISASSELSVESGSTVIGGVDLTSENSSVNFQEGAKFVYTGDAIRFTGTAGVDDVDENGEAKITVEIDESAMTVRGERKAIFESVSGTGNGIGFGNLELSTTATGTGMSYFYDSDADASGAGLYIYVVGDLNNAGVSLHKGLDDRFIASLNWIQKEAAAGGRWETLSEDEQKALADHYALAEAIIKTPNGSLSAALTNLSPLGYGATLALPQSGFLADVSAVSARIEQRRYDNYASFIWETKNDWEFFAQAQGTFAEADEATDTRTFDMNTYGILAGADVKLDATSVAGFALAGDYGKADFRDGGGDADGFDLRATAFFGTLFADRFYLDTGAQAGFAAYDVKRHTLVGSASGDTTVWHAGVFANFGTLIPLLVSEDEKSGLNLMPYVGLAYSYYNAGSFDEKGAATALDTDSFDASSLRASIGASLVWTFPCFGRASRLNLDAAYSHELLDTETDIDYTMPKIFDGVKYSAESPIFTEDTFSIGPRFSIDVTRLSSVYAGYRFEVSTDSDTAHSVNIGFRSRF